MSELRIEKRRLRGEMLARRDRAPKHELMSRSNAIIERLEALPAFQEAQSILVYVSMGSEVETLGLIKRWLGRKEIVVPKVAKDSLETFVLKDFSQLSPSHFGVLEPVDGERVLLDRVGLVLVPGIAFDRQGYRLGYGKGYYDRLLSAYGGRTIGLAYSFQITEALPREPWDIPVEALCHD